MTEPRKCFSEDAEREFHVTSTFKEFTHWNLDRNPSVNDKIQQAFQYIDIANMVRVRQF